MNWLEDELMNLFQRKEPPEGFSERVLARLEVAPSRFHAPARRRSVLPEKAWVGWAAAVAACLLFAISLAQHRRYQHERTEADLASRQATVGLRIASTQLNMALQEARQVTEQALPALPALP